MTNCAEGISSLSATQIKSVAERIPTQMVTLAADKCLFEDDMDLNGCLWNPRSGYSSPSTRASSGTTSDVDDEETHAPTCDIDLEDLFGSDGSTGSNDRTRAGSDGSTGSIIVSTDERALGNTVADSMTIAKVPAPRKALNGAQFRSRCYADSSIPEASQAGLVSPSVQRNTVDDQDCHVHHLVEQRLEDDVGMSRARDHLQRRMRSRRLGYVGAVAPSDLAAHLGRATLVPLPVSDSSLTEEYFLAQEDEGVQDFLSRGARRRMRRVD